MPRKWLGEAAPIPRDSVYARIEEAIETYRRLGAEIVDIELPMAELGVPVYYVVALCRSQLQPVPLRRRSLRSPRCRTTLTSLDMIKKSRDEGFGPEPKRRILIGTYVLSHGYYDAYYIKAQQVRRLIAEEFDHIFAENCDVIAARSLPMLLSASTTRAIRFLFT